MQNLLERRIQGSVDLISQPFHELSSHVSALEGKSPKNAKSSGKERLSGGFFEFDWTSISNSPSEFTGMAVFGYESGRRKPVIVGLNDLADFMSDDIVSDDTQPVSYNNEQELDTDLQVTPIKISDHIRNIVLRNDLRSTDSVYQFYGLRKFNGKRKFTGNFVPAYELRDVDTYEISKTMNLQIKLSGFIIKGSLRYCSIQTGDEITVVRDLLGGITKDIRKADSNVKDGGIFTSEYKFYGMLKLDNAVVYDIGEGTEAKFKSIVLDTSRVMFVGIEGGIPKRYVRNGRCWRGKLGENVNLRLDGYSKMLENFSFGNFDGAPYVKVAGMDLMNTKKISYFRGVLLRKRYSHPLLQ